MSKPITKVKSYYDVKVECIVPTTIMYRVLADDEQDALNIMNKMMKDNKAPTHTKSNLSMKRIIKAMVYVGGSSTIKLVKNYMAR